MADGPQQIARNRPDLADGALAPEAVDGASLADIAIPLGSLAAGGLTGRGLTTQSMLSLQRTVGNQAATRVLNLQRAVAPPAEIMGSPEPQTQRERSGGLMGAIGGFFGSMPMIQRKVYKDGGKGATAIPAAAKSTAKWVTTKASVQPGGSNHIADIQNRGFPGFKKGKDEHAGGRVFNNNPAKDGSRLPYSSGQTYQEWDVNPCVAGGARDGERIVTSSDGKVYYSNNHYDDFTEFEP